MPRSIKLLLLLFLSILPILAFGQGSKRGGGGGGATPPSSAPASGSPSSATPTPGTQSGSTQLEQGYHYILPARTFLKYLYIDSSNVRTVTSVAPPKNVVTVTITKTLFINTSNRRAPTIDTLPCPSIVIKTTPYDTSVRMGPCVDRGTYLDSTINIIIVDSLDRWAAQDIHVSITQADSGKLTIGILESYIAPGDSTLVKPGEVEQRNEELSDNIPKNWPIQKKTYQGKEHYAVRFSQHDLVGNSYLHVLPKIKFSDTTYYISTPYHLWQAGPVTIPYKFRFPNSRKIGGVTSSATQPTPVGTDSISAPSEATAAINLALYVGYKFGRTRYYYDATKSHNTWAGMISGFLGASVIPLTASNVYDNTNLSKNPGSLLAITTGVAASFEIGSFSFGVFTGFDIPLQSNSVWVYKGMPWVGFGVGYNLAMFTNSTNPQPLNAW